MALNQQRFKEQMAFLSTYYLRDFPVDLLNEYWIRFKDKDQVTWDRAIDAVVREEKWFPLVAVLQDYYEMHLPSKEQPAFPSMKDLDKQAKEGKHKKYMRLIEGLLAGEIKIDNSEILECLKKQGNHPTYKRFNPEKRVFEKI